MQTEKGMRPIVEYWLQGRGYYVAHEVMVCGYCDLIGCLWKKRDGRRIPTMLEIMTVELKIKDIKGVLAQAVANCRYAEYSYAAMPIQKCESMRFTTKQRFEKRGVGLLSVSHCVEIIVAPHKNEIVHRQNICRRLWNFKIRHRNKSEV